MLLRLIKQMSLLNLMPLSLAHGLKELRLLQVKHGENPGLASFLVATSLLRGELELFEFHLNPMLHLPPQVFHGAYEFGLHRGDLVALSHPLEDVDVLGEQQLHHIDGADQVVDLGEAQPVLLAFLESRRIKVCLQAFQKFV